MEMFARPTGAGLAGDRRQGFAWHVSVRSPVDTTELFAAAREIVGLAAQGDWQRLDDGPVHTVQTRPGQGAAASVSVHFPAGGGPYPRHPSEQHLAKLLYARVVIEITETDRASVRTLHLRILKEFGTWLASRHLRWDWFWAHLDLRSHGCRSEAYTEHDYLSTDPLWRDRLDEHIRASGGRWDSTRMLHACHEAGHFVTVQRAREIFRRLADARPDLLMKVEGKRWLYDTVPPTA